ncbi:STAS domain-containing protein [Streptomyces sp. NPDC091272]|uniref:STAS domain-containing protein n=1 Tax=Streptomyces sp. NPDC091272 TaxID=3365981 RepID=UPI003822A6F6
MSTPPPALHLTTVDADNRVRVEITGDLDHDTADLLLEEVTALLAARPHLEDLHLHCGGLGTVDSMGLSVLLMIGRRTTAAQVRLHLADRPSGLERLLAVTGTLEHFRAMTTTAANPQLGTAHPPLREEKAGAARPTGPDGTT